MSRFSPQPITSRVKLPAVERALEELVRHLGPGGKFPRVRDLATDLGITLATLDQGLNRLEQRGRIVRKGRTGIFVSASAAVRRIGLVFGGNIFSDPADHFYRLLLEACARSLVARQHAYSVFFDVPEFNESSDGRTFAHDDLVFALNSRRLDGVILAFSQGGEQEAWLRSQGLPLVAVAGSALTGTVRLDEGYLIRLALGGLRAEGCRSVGLIHCAGPSPGGWFQESAREMGFATCKDWNVTDQIVYGSFRFEEAGRQVARIFLERNHASLPDALILTNDIIARGALPVLSAAGVNIGSQLKIASHANKGSSALAEWAPHLLLCEVDPAEIAETLCDQLETLLAGGRLIEPVVQIRPHLQTPFPSLNRIP